MLIVHFPHLANVWYFAWRNNSDGARDRVCHHVHDRFFERERVRGHDRVRSCNVFQYPEVTTLCCCLEGLMIEESFVISEVYSVSTVWTVWIGQMLCKQP